MPRKKATPPPAPEPPPTDPTGEYVVGRLAVQDCWCWAPLHEWVYQGQRNRQAALWAATAADIVAYHRAARQEHDVYSAKGFCLRHGQCYSAGPRPPDPKIPPPPPRSYRRKPPKRISLIVAFTLQEFEQVKHIRVRVKMKDLAAAERFIADAFSRGLRVVFYGWVLYVPPSALTWIRHRNPHNPAGYPVPEFTEEELEGLDLTPEYEYAWIEPFTELPKPCDPENTSE